MTPRQLLVFVVLLVWYSSIGHIRANEWTSELSLWVRAVSISPLEPRNHLNLAKALYGEGRDDEANKEVFIVTYLENLRGKKGRKW